MFNKLLSILVLFSFVSFVAFVAFQDKPTVYIISDSTAADKEQRLAPETGWGMPFKDCFDSSIKVDNRAANGRSAKTFINE
jgi:hypothetical protein